MGSPSIIDRPITLSHDGIESLIRAPSIIERAISLRPGSVKASLHLCERAPQGRRVWAKVARLNLNLPQPPQ